jgi:hypothetical protein
VSLRLISAELLKLRKRRGLFWWSLALTVGLITVVFAIVEILHLADPAQHGPAGGRGALMGASIALTSAGGIAAIVVGTTAGAGDVTAGVFRDLVATGRSRWELYTARIPGALAMLLPMVTLGYAVAATCAVVLTGSMREPHGLLIVGAPRAALIAKEYAWVLLSTAFDLVLALGFASVVGSRATTIGVLIGYQFIAEPLLGRVLFLGRLRYVFFTSALNRLDPLLPAERVDYVTKSVTVSVIAIVVWLVAAFVVGGWRTATRDA